MTGAIGLSIVSFEFCPINKKKHFFPKNLDETVSLIGTDFKLSQRVTSFGCWPLLVCGVLVSVHQRGSANTKTDENGH